MRTVCSVVAGAAGSVPAGAGFVGGVSTGTFVATEVTTAPAAYAVPAVLAEVVERLERNLLADGRFERVFSVVGSLPSTASGRRTLGENLATDLVALTDRLALPVSLSPYPGLPFLYFDPELATGQPERRDRFYAALVERGVFAHPRHHGFLCWRHNQEDMATLLGAVEDAAASL